MTNQSIPKPLLGASGMGDAALRALAVALALGLQSRLVFLS